MSCAVFEASRNLTGKAPVGTSVRSTGKYELVLTGFYYMCQCCQSERYLYFIAVVTFERCHLLPLLHMLPLCLFLMQYKRVMSCNGMF